MSIDVRQAIHTLGFILTVLVVVVLLGFFVTACAITILETLGVLR